MNGSSVAASAGRRLEPTLDIDSSSTEASSDEGLPQDDLRAKAQDSPGSGQEGVDEIAQDSRLTVQRTAALRSRTRLSPLIDVLATMPLEAPIAAEVALACMPSSWRAGSKPMMIEGLNAENGEWEFPLMGQRYSEFQAGVQMANRAGAINQIEYSEFVQKVQAFAEGIGSDPECEDMIEAVNRARELDAFANNHDAQLALHLRSAGVAWSVGFVQQVASRHGFVAGAMAGRLVLPSDEDDGPPVVVLGLDQQAALAEDPDSSTVLDVTLSLDVPQTAEALRPFERWRQLAGDLARDLDAVLIDDDGRPIEPTQLAALESELQRLYRSLESRELAAGTGAARRLFS